YAGEPSVAAGITVTVGPPAADFRVGMHRAVTDAEGLAHFDGLAPGPVRVESSIRATSAKVEIVAGTTSECTLQMRGTMTVTGVVVDPGGVPVGGALVEVAIASLPGVDADQVAATAADGTFSIRECYVHCLVGARAEGYAASRLYDLEGRVNGTEPVRIELRTSGGAVEGIVVDATGEPVVGAVVRVGEGRTECILSTTQGAPPLPAQVRTDATGRFRAIGLPAGKQPVQVRTTNLAPWRGECEVAAGTTVAVRIVLAAGITCTGSVRGDDGQPVADATVTVGDAGDFVLLRTRSGTDGTFALTGLPVGEFTLAAKKDRVGQTTARLIGKPGEQLRCELQIGLGLALRARVVEATGAPISRVEIRIEAEGDGARWTSTAFSGEDGRFVVGECPPGRTLALLASKRDHMSLKQQALQPGGPELELRLQRDTAVKARITGRLLRPDGSPATGEDVEAIRFQTPSEAQLKLAAKVRDDGSFVIEAPAGQWQGRILVKGHPEIRFSPGKLDAGGASDAGVLQLTVGGTLVARIDGGAAKTDNYTVLDTREHAVCSLWPPVTPLRSDLIAPGDYLLLAQGEGIVAQVLPFTIHSGRETDLTVPRQTGVRQWIEFDLAPGTERPSYVEFEVRRGATLAAWTHARGQPGAPFRREVWLAPGSYTLATHNREPQAAATFSVGDTEGPPLRVVVR
ncbi:MAG: carboxypeptidase-like regulatory domain-containing protein, partial [Planctomycetota bacterium]